MQFAQNLQTYLRPQIKALRYLLLPCLFIGTQSLANNEVTYWQYFMVDYLGTNINKLTHTAQVPFLPASPNLNTQAFDNLSTQSSTLKLAATGDTQTLLNGWLNNNLSLSTYFNGTLNNITPNIVTPPSSPFGNSTPPTPNNSSLNLDALLSQHAIAGLNHSNASAESGNPAINFILLASNALDPLNFEQSRGSRSQEEWFRYLATSWGITAKMSIALSNLFHMLRQREVVTDLGTNTGMPKANASPREVEAYLAQRRLTSTWFTQMEQASPIVIQRESLHVQAEIQRLLFLSKEQDERVLVTLSALLAQGIEMAKEMRKLQKQIDAAQAQASANLKNTSGFSL